jgi:cysteinyl-tRNA synthetase
VIRYLLLSTHYRKPFDFNQKALDDAKKSLEKFHALLTSNDFAQGKNKPELVSKIILGHLAQDLNISKAIASLHEIAKEIKANNDKNLKIEFAATLDFLGLVEGNPLAAKEAVSEIDESFIKLQIELRLKAKQEKNFQLADEIRQNMLAKGILLEDVGKNETFWKRS